MATADTDTKNEIRARLRAAAEQVRTYRELHQAAVAARNAIIFEAIDVAGLSHRDTAREAGVSYSRLESVLANQ